MAKKQEPARQIVAQNRKARHDYFIDETMEAGVALLGTEVKTLREGKGNLVDAYATEEGGELWMLNAYIPEYGSGSHFNHEPRRKRKLLLHKRELAKLYIAVQQKGMTIIPLAIYFNDRGIAKVEIGLARGKKQYDKRETDKKRDWQRQKARIVREMS